MPPPPNKEPEEEEENNNNVPQIDLQALMTSAEFQSTGLDRLSSDELKLLNAWLSTNQGKLFPVGGGGGGNG